jgi:uncharacterized protein involved in exopolysaccharide biosynthesis
LETSEDKLNKKLREELERLREQLLKKMRENSQNQPKVVQDTKSLDSVNAQLKDLSEKFKQSLDRITKLEKDVSEHDDSMNK